MEKETRRTDQALHAEAREDAYRIDDGRHGVAFIWVELATN